MSTVDAATLKGRRGGVGRWTPVWIATGHTIRPIMNSPALLVREAFMRDPHGGELYVLRGKSGKLIKML